MTGERAEDRVVLSVGGADRISFLQGLLSNDVAPLARKDAIVWSALLTPQGKYLADFFVISREGALLIDIKDSLADAAQRRLSMYRLRADVQIAPAPLCVVRGLGLPPDGAFADPRHPALGWRAYVPPNQAPAGPPMIDWDAIRVAHCIPESGVELIPDDSYLLETGFERLHGVDFRKGCYVGQEVTARMKHKTELRKGLVRVAVEGQAPIGSEILADGKPVGTLFTQSRGEAIAFLRLDRANGPLTAGTARLQILAE